jgi:hypothetical protein
MVVMKRIDGHDMHEENIPEEDLTRIRATKGLLHENDYVFGDRSHNNIFKPANGLGVKSVVFGWCGKEGVDRYPLMTTNDLTSKCGKSVRSSFQ